MKHTSVILATVAALAFGASAIAAEVEKVESKTTVEADSKGNSEVKKSTTSTDKEGTTTKEKVKEETEVKADGSKEVTSKTKTSHDPKGLMNKTTHSKEVTKKFDAKGNEVKAESVEKVDGKVVDKTEEVIEEKK
jgi:preprotein translocase subunit SecF